MNMRTMQLLKLHKLYAPKDEGNDGGGGDATTIDDNDGGDDTTAGVDRGDDVETPLDAEALARVAGDDDTTGPGGDDTLSGGDDTAPGAEGSKKGSTHVPMGRFNEVNEKAKRLEREVADLKKAQEPRPTPQPTPPPKPAFDEDKAEREYATLLAEGEFDKAVGKRKEINAHLKETARTEAEENVTRNFEQRQAVATLTQVADQAVKDYPLPISRRSRRSRRSSGAATSGKRRATRCSSSASWAPARTR
jgi:hypothetical protein